MTSNRDLAPTLLLDTPKAVLVAERALSPVVSYRSRRVGRSRALGRIARCSYSPSGMDAPKIGRLIITRVDQFGAARPAPIASIAVHAASPTAPAPTVLEYRGGALATGCRGRAYYAGPARTVLGKPGLSRPARVGALA